MVARVKGFNQDFGVPEDLKVFPSVPLGQLTHFEQSENLGLVVSALS